ncbi:MAG: UPF0158 family protein [Proteobacteria bacterium]|nr:UPF0158 family protein [Pseudomonadota bacterium]MCL2306682.1 UPF0158 family protein [Pseudomonadota bacterium]
MSAKKTVCLEDVAQELDMANDEIDIYYNTETGEFVYDSPYDMEEDKPDLEELADEKYIGLPSQYELNGYGMMRDFVEGVSDPHKQALLSVALEGKGAFRRFKDTLHRVDLTKEWYAFKAQALIEKAREWCEENEIPCEYKKTV